MLCAAADKNGEGIKNPDTHLFCYKVELLDEKNDRVRRIFVGDQFDSGRIRIDAGTPRELCVPSTVLPLPKAKA